MWQPAFAAFALFLAKQSWRGWQMVLSSTIALAIAGFLFALFPAVGAAEYYHFPVHTPTPPFHPVLIALKSGAMRVMDERTFAGMISFPSYHAAAATILAWGCWTTIFRWPVVALNVLMCLSAISMGSHYLVDILGGVAVAALSIALSVKIVGTAPSGRRN
jgi:membrane-associated phospholipid phosphatase